MSENTASSCSRTKAGGSSWIAVTPTVFCAVKATSSEAPSPAGWLCMELRLVLTVDDFEQALAFYRDSLGLAELEAWQADRDARVVLLDAGRATLELVNEAQAAMIDEIEVGRRV